MPKWNASSAIKKKWCLLFGAWIFLTLHYPFPQSWEFAYKFKDNYLKAGFKYKITEIEKKR